MIFGARHHLDFRAELAQLLLGPGITADAPVVEQQIGGEVLNWSCDGYLPRKHTVLVQPGSRISYRVTADAEGSWAYHCHLLYHMPGMFREVRVV